MVCAQHHDDYTGEDGTTPPTSNTTNTALPVGMGAELRLHQTNTQYLATKEAQPNRRHCRRSDRHANSSERWCTIQHVTTRYDEERVRVVAAHEPNKAYNTARDGMSAGG